MPRVVVDDTASALGWIKPQSWLLNFEPMAQLAASIAALSVGKWWEIIRDPALQLFPDGKIPLPVKE